MLIVLIAALALGACSGGGGTSGAPLGCSRVPHPFELTGNLTSPASGASGVPTTIGSVSVQYQAELVGAAVELQPNNSPLPNAGIFTGGNFVVSGNGSTLTATIPALSPGTLYFVTATAPHTVGGCTELRSWSFGSFST